MNTDKQTWKEKFRYDLQVTGFSNQAVKVIIEWIDSNKELIGQEELNKAKLTAKHWKEMWQNSLRSKNFYDRLYNKEVDKNFRQSTELQKRNNENQRLQSEINRLQSQSISQEGKEDELEESHINFAAFVIENAADGSTAKELYKQFKNKT